MRDHASSAIAALVSIFLVLIQTSAHAAYTRPGILLSPWQRRIYHECLVQDWISEYCRANSWGILSTYNRTYVGCVAAQNHGSFVLSGRPRGVNMEGYCWSKAHGFTR